MDTILTYLQGSVFSFCAVMAFLFLRSKNLHHLATGGVMALWASQYLLRCPALSTLFGPEEFTERIADIYEMSSVPGCAFILFSLTRVHKLNWKIVSLHELPVVLGLITYCIWPSLIVVQVLQGYMIMYGLYIYVISFREIRIYHKNIYAYYSNDEDRDIDWLQYLLTAFLVLMFCWGLLSVYMENYWSAIAYGVISTSLWAVMLVFIYDHKEIQEGVINYAEETDNQEITNNNSDEQEGNSDESEDSGYGFESALEVLMNDAKVWLEPTLSVNELALRLNTNRTYLSRYINQHKNQTFFEFINERRMQTAEELLRTTSLTMSEVATQSGYNSLNNFRRIFARYHNCKPSEYREQHQTRL